MTTRTYATIGNETLSLTEWAEKADLIPATVRNRYRRGKRGLELIEPLKSSGMKARIVTTIGDETLSLSEWAKRYNLPNETVRKRYYAGLRGLELVAGQYRCRKKPKLPSEPQFTQVQIDALIAFACRKFSCPPAYFVNNRYSDAAYCARLYVVGVMVSHRANWPLISDMTELPERLIEALVRRIKDHGEVNERSVKAVTDEVLHGRAAA